MQAKIGLKVHSDETVIITSQDQTGNIVVFSLLGTPFYIMEHVPGRVFKDIKLEEMTPEERHKIYSAMVDVLVKIHKVNITEAGLDDYGKKGLFDFYY